MFHALSNLCPSSAFAHLWECIDKRVPMWYTDWLVLMMWLFAMVTETKPLQCAPTRARWAFQREQHPAEKIFVQIIVRRQTQHNTVCSAHCHSLASSLQYSCCHLRWIKMHFNYEVIYLFIAHYARAAFLCLAVFRAMISYAYFITSSLNLLGALSCREMGTIPFSELARQTKAIRWGKMGGW